MLPPRVLLRRTARGQLGGGAFTQPVSKHFPSLNLPTEALKLFLVPAASCSAGSWHSGAIQGWCLRTCLHVAPAPGLRARGEHPHAQETSDFQGQMSILGDTGGCLPSHPPGWRRVGVLGAAPELRPRLPGEPEQLGVRGGGMTERVGWAW